MTLTEKGNDDGENRIYGVWFSGFEETAYDGTSGRGEERPSCGVCWGMRRKDTSSHAPAETSSHATKRSRNVSFRDITGVLLSVAFPVSISLCLDIFAFSLL